MLSKFGLIFVLKGLGLGAQGFERCMAGLGLEFRAYATGIWLQGRT